jgi:hypothetical protein
MVEEYVSTYNPKNVIQSDSKKIYMKCLKNELRALGNIEA